MKPSFSSTGLPTGIPFALPADWTPEQALAVFELLDEMRDHIWARYGLQLMELIREQRLPASTVSSNDNFDDPPF